LKSTAGVRTIAELQVDAELGADRNGVIRFMITDRSTARQPVEPRARLTRRSGERGLQNFRAGIDEYLALMPPNSHGEANPADKDPVPLPFDQHL